MPSAVVEFTVALHPNDNVCLPGDLVRGAVQIVTVQHIRFTGIRITVKGRAFVHWTEQNLRGPGEPRYKDTHHYSSTEDYFNHSVLLLAKVNKDKPEKCLLPAGRYSYPFHFQLPAQLPSSFEGNHGYIRYWVKATIEKGRELRHVTKLPFTVISPLDLNNIRDTNVPIQESTEKNMCCWCCLSGPIVATLCLQKRGFVPGEPIKFGVEISNMSSRKLGCSSVELKMTTTYHTPKKSRSITKQIAKIKRHSVSKGDNDVWMSDQLIVPALPPSYLVGCGIIQVSYILELRIDPVGPAFDLELPVPVVIGTIPHYPSQEHHYANTNHGASNCHHDNYQRLPVGRVPLFPGHGNQFMYSPAHVNHSSNQPSPSNRGSDNQNEAQGHIRPSSRSSSQSAPSTTSSQSYAHSHKSIIFAESAFGKSPIKFDDDNQHTDGKIRFAPLYPYYQWTK